LLAKNKKTTTEHESSTLSSNGRSGSNLASESEVSDEESDSDTTPQIESPKPTVLKPESHAPSGSSSSDDESDEDSEPEAKQRGKPEVIDAKMSSDDCGSSSSSDEESSADEMELEQKATAERKAPSSSLGHGSTTQMSQNRNAASSSESDSESDSKRKKSALAAAKKASSTSTPPPPKNSTLTKHNSNSSKYTKTHTAPPAAKEKEASGASKNRLESSTANTVTGTAKPTAIHQKDETRVTKKRRMDVEGSSVATAVAAPLEPDAVSSWKNKKGNKAPRTMNNRFMRVDPTKVQSVMHNDYVCKVRQSLPLQCINLI